MVLARFRDFVRPEHAPRSPAGTHICTVVYRPVPCVPRSREREKGHAVGRERVRIPQKSPYTYVHVEFTLNHSFYPTSAVHPIPVLILHPRDTNSVVTDCEIEKTKNESRLNQGRQIRCQRAGHVSTTNTPTKKLRNTKNKIKGILR